MCVRFHFCRILDIHVLETFSVMSKTVGESEATDGSGEKEGQLIRIPKIACSGLLQYHTSTELATGDNGR